MSDGVSSRDANLRMMLQARGAGQYGYVIGRPDLEEWGEPSLETFATEPAAGLKPGNVSATVGRSGKSGSRLVAPTASALE
jgi:hypothetical protein